MLHPTEAHYHALRLSHMSEIGKVFWAHTLATLGGFLLTIFIPIYLLKTGYSLTAILLFLAQQGFFALLLQFYASKVISLFGANKSMAIGIAAQIGYFVLLITLPSMHWPLSVLAFAWGVHRTTYWAAFHANFSKANQHKEAGKKIGLIQAIVAFGKGASPAIGGVLASELGINWVYGVGITLSVLAVLPLLRGGEITTRRKAVMRSLNFKKIRPDLVASMANATTSISEAVLWPLFVFILVPSYAAVGILSSTIALAALLTSVYVGRRQARVGTRHFLRQGVTLASFSDVLRLLVQNAGHVFGVNLFGGIGNSLYMTPYFSRYYKHADEEPRIEYITAMEASHAFAWMLLPLALVPFTLVFPDKTVLLIGIGVAIPANFIIRKIR